MRTDPVSEQEADAARAREDGKKKSAKHMLKQSAIVSSKQAHCE